MKLKMILYFIICTMMLMSCKTKSVKKENHTATKLKALIIDGENNHGIWPKTSFMMKDYLEETGLFDVDISRKAFIWIGPHYNPVDGITDINDLLKLYPLKDTIQYTQVDSTKYDPNFSPNFENYDLVISNLGWKSSEWPEQTKKKFEDYITNGGGLVIIHAANNAWGNWEAYNDMIGLGAWGGRDKSSGPYIYYDSQNNILQDSSEGICASHGKQHEFQIKSRAREHPIMKNLPELWLHTKDELYDRMRGQGKNMTILATAYSDIEKNAPPWNKKIKGTGRNEPILMAIEYGKGRIFHSALGHMDYSFECVGFITTFQRGAEWAATGNVTQKIPKDFPNSENTSVRKYNK